MGPVGIGGLLNARSAAGTIDAQSQLRRLQQPLHMDTAYAMDHQSAMAHHHHHPHQMAHPNHMTYATMGAHQHPQMISTNFMTPHSNPPMHTTLNSEQMKPKPEPAPKAFACSTCSKGFARRSDLARHERIHSGVRPHACDYPNCGKQFIQRSALTVHARVHTGEKPHMCERCGKPFSDSSSLARHRRIHSGKRPYQCPFANCQKTFTRRTTLTRHQNNHAGTVEQAEAETNAKLALTQSQPQSRSNQSSYSEVASRNSTVSPTRPLSISPTQAVPTMSAMPAMQKSNSEFSYVSQGPIIPQHMRAEFHHSSARLPPSMNSAPLPSFMNGPQPGSQMTSHPSAYRPPQAHEPPASSGNDSTASSHLNGIGWTGEGSNNLNNTNGMDQFQFQDPAYGGQPLYYQGSNLRRPQSTEPEDYGVRARYMAHHMPATGMPMSTGEWTAMPMNLHDIKPERAYAN